MNSPSVNSPSVNPCRQTGLILAALAVVMLFAGCSQGPERLPRSNRVSVVDLERGEGTDFCDRYPQPETQPFVPEPGSGLEQHETDHVRGNPDAPVTIILYSNVQCEGCAEVFAAIRQVIADHPDDVRLLFRHYPHSRYDKSQIAAEALEAAAAQGGDEAFFAMLDLLYEQQAEWSPLDEEAFAALLVEYAAGLGLDAGQFSADLQSGQYTDRVNAAGAWATVLGLQDMPVLIVNDLGIRPATNGPEMLENVVRLELIKQTYTELPPMVIDGRNDYVAWIVTPNGTVGVDLFANIAPQTVNNFAYLACTGFYDNNTFHRVIPGFMAQGGDPTGTGYVSLGYTIPDEYENSDLVFDQEGWVSMAHTSEPDSAGAQFFITYGPAEHLNGAFTIFGRVAGEGIGIVRTFTPRDLSRSDLPVTEPTKIITIIVREIER